MFLLPNSILPSANDPVAEIWAKSLSELNAKYSGGIDCSSKPLFHDYEKFSKGTTRFSQTFIKTNLGKKNCTSILSNEIKFIAAIFLTEDQL